MEKIKQEQKGITASSNSRLEIVFMQIYVAVLLLLAALCMVQFIRKNSDFELGEDQVSELSASSTETSKGYGGSPLFKDDE